MPSDHLRSDRGESKWLRNAEKESIRAARERKSAARCTGTNGAAPRAAARQGRQGKKPQTGDRDWTFQGTQEREESSSKEALRAFSAASVSVFIRLRTRPGRNQRPRYCVILTARAGC